MITGRDVVIFFAGVEFFHTLAHIFFAFFVSLPLNLTFMIMTSTINNWGIIINGIITLMLLWWAKELSKIRR